MRPDSLPEAAACEGHPPPEAAGCKQNTCRSLASTLHRTPLQAFGGGDTGKPPPPPAAPKSLPCHLPTLWATRRTWQKVKRLRPQAPSTQRLTWGKWSEETPWPVGHVISRAPARCSAEWESFRAGVFGGPVSHTALAASGACATNCCLFGGGLTRNVHETQDTSWELGGSSIRYTGSLVDGAHGADPWLQVRATGGRTRTRVRSGGLGYGGSPDRIPHEAV